ncbi:MAG: coth protein-domain-containing protein [Benjaminiella poitrasii]|nr:MAG: coth protein-domain-containing protein [Benjaminiella poitrasii]
MRVLSAFTILTAVITSSISAAVTNIQYKVISLVPNNETVGVIVDDKLYQLTAVSESAILLHTGEAPIASRGYKYAILSKNDSTIVREESFTRSPANYDTINEHYGRSWNRKQLNQLPTIMNPLPIIHRIESDLHIDGQIPTIHIIGNQTALDEIHSKRNEDIEIKMNMTYISLDNVKTFDNVTFAISGHSTRRSAKISYKFSIPKKNDLHSYRRFKLRAMSTDVSYMREEITHKIAESVGLPASRFSYVRLYINDKPLGLFGLAEVFKNPWIRNEFGNGSKKFKQGGFYVADLGGGRRSGGGGPPPEDRSDDRRQKRSIPMTYQTANENGFSNFDDSLIRHEIAEVKDLPENHRGPRGIRGNMSDLSYIGTNLTLYSDYYSLKEKPSAGEANYTRIMELAKFISEQPNNTLVDNSVVPLWQEKLDTDSALRSLAFELVVSNADGYLTMGNNYMLYDDLENERIVMAEQDLDLTMGKTIFNATLVNGGNWTEFPGFTVKPLSSRMYCVPQFREELENLILNYTRGIMNPDILFPLVDQLYDMLQEDVAWDKSLPRVVPEIPRRPESPGGRKFREDVPFDVAVNGPSDDPQNLGLKEWISLRSSNLLNFYYERL